MRALKLFTAFCLGMAQIQVHAGQDKGYVTPPLRYQLEQAFAIYATLETTNQAFAYFKVGASASDVKFLDGMTRRLNGTRLPKVTVKGQLIYFAGLAKPLAVVDLSRGLFSYGGRRVDLKIGSGGFETKMNELERIFSEESTGWFSWLMPRAHAMDRNGLLGIVSGAMLGGGLAMTVAGLFSGGAGMGMGLGMAALGAIGLYTANERAKKAKRTVKCFVDPTGVKRVVAYNGEGAEVLSVMPPTPAQTAPNIVPSYTGTYPPPPTAISPIVSICHRSAVTQSFNTALAAPPVLAPPGGNTVPYLTPPALLAPASLDGAPAESERYSE